MFHIGQQPGRFIAGRLDHPAVELCQGRFHPRIPAGLITGLSQLFQKNEIALRVHRDEAQAAGKRFILGHREVFLGHILGQACGFILVVGHHRVFNVEIDLLLSPIGGCDKAVETRQVQEETNQANAACPDFDTHQMEGNHNAVQERQAGTALKELGDVGTDIQGVVPYAPGWQGGSRHLDLLGGLTLGDALGSQLPVLLKKVRAFESTPRGWPSGLRCCCSWMTVPTATSFVNPSPFNHHG